MDESEETLKVENGLDTQQITIQAVVTLDPVYSNHISVVGMPHETILDFFEAVSIGEGEGSARHVARVIVPLSMLKGLHGALGDQIARYEADGRQMLNMRPDPA